MVESQFKIPIPQIEAHKQIQKFKTLTFFKFIINQKRNSYITFLKDMFKTV